ncbi:MAG TPA: DUF1440 domain-containing protein [Terriglobales bacterium]|nr:DUF1440 domain-containing protein [Terriglobales bacterium]
MRTVLQRLIAKAHPILLMEIMNMKRAKSDTGKALLVGLGSGLVAAWVMNRFQSAFSKVSRIAKEDEPKHSAAQSNIDAGESEDATMKAANRIIRRVLRRELSKEDKKKAGPIVHYAFGAGMGALYSLAAKANPKVTRGFGTAFGAVLFAAADELSVPALGLSKGPKDYPLSSHASALAAHLVYGATTEGIRRASLAIL